MTSKSAFFTVTTKTLVAIAWLRVHTLGKLAEVRRILDRYLVEVVEKYDLCPWARQARTSGDLAVEIVLGTPTLAEWIAAGLARPDARVTMVVAPDLAVDLAGLRVIRDRVAAATAAGVAEFHPDAPLDLATPARLVPFLRRSPDPMLQLVPLALLAAVRAAPPPPRAEQAQILAGLVAPPRALGEQIAAANHATVAAHHLAIAATLADIAADRRAAYGLSACR
jgi:hypothetical protein